MLFKSFALVAACAAFVPALAVPVSDNVVPVRRQLADVGVVVDNILNNDTISILSSRGAGARRQLADVGVVVDNLLNNATVSILSSRDAGARRQLVGAGVVVDNILNNATVSVLSSRGAKACSVSEISSIASRVLNDPFADVTSLSKRGGCNPVAIRDETYNILSKLYIRDVSPTLYKRGMDDCSLVDIDAALSNILNNADITVLKRDGCDLVELDVLVTNVLNNLDVDVLTPSKRDVTRTTVGLVVSNVLNNLKGYVASQTKRGDEATVAQITAIVTNLLNNLNIKVGSS